MKVTIDINSDTFWHTEPDPDDQWDSGSAGLEIHGVRVRRTEADYGWEIDSPDFRAVVLVEHYSDGNTFGSYEEAEVKGIFPTAALAREHADAIRTDHGYFGSHIAFLYFDVILP